MLMLKIKEYFRQFYQCCHKRFDCNTKYTWTLTSEKWLTWGTSLVVQWWGLCLSTAGGMGLILGQRTKVPCALRATKKEKLLKWNTGKTYKIPDDFKGGKKKKEREKKKSPVVYFSGNKKGIRSSKLDPRKSTKFSSQKISSKTSMCKWRKS